MKYRESGMPSEATWDAFFKPIDMINKIGINSQIRTLIDIGCGYGIFLLPIAEIVSSKAIGIDIDDAMIEVCRDKITEHNSSKIQLINGDICNDSTLNMLNNYKGEIDFITLFNILHCEEPITLLKNAYNILNDDGRIAITHWKYEKTPRGPSMEIRPKPEMIIKWALKAGLALDKHVDLPPYHYGLVFIKK
ncbi:class I SAM-dependent methyltransferase [Acetobacterium malicum]|uniref:class I SAM-dependent methyltransferase n=1 Tax=Acetobacterium malicum TaxID=52692 RepID=UPI00047D64D4|nr:class I SAM-dependent methyltransferase [Acetobacterium dehalogenans]